MVDNASDDGSYESLLRLISQGLVNRVKVLRSPVNSGYAGGNNLGYKHLDPSVKYFALMNNDFVLFPGVLEALVSILEKNPRIGAIQGQILGDNQRVNSGFHMNEILEGIPIRQKGPTHEVAYTSGSFSAYRREVVRRIEREGLLFSPRTFAYLDDNFLGLKLWEAGYKCVCADIEAGYHKSLGSFGGRLWFQFYLSNRAWLALLTASNSRYRVFELLTAGRLAFIGILRVFVNRDPMEFLYALRAWIDGIRLGKELVVDRGRVAIYAAPIQSTSPTQIVFAIIWEETLRLIERLRRRTPLAPPKERAQHVVD